MPLAFAFANVRQFEKNLAVWSSYGEAARAKRRNIRYLREKYHNRVENKLTFVANFGNIYFNGKSSEHLSIDTDTLKDT